MAPPLRLNAVAFVSSQNHPILIKTFGQSPQEELRYHYIAHTSLDVIDERSSCSFYVLFVPLPTDNSIPLVAPLCTVSAATAAKSTDCYLGLLFVEDVAVYGFMTPLKAKIIIALELSDQVVRESDIIAVSSPLVSSFYFSFLHRFHQIFKALHTAYRQSIANPFLKLNTPTDNTTDHSTIVSAGSPRWKAFRQRVEQISQAVSTGVPISTR